MEEYPIRKTLLMALFDFFPHTHITLSVWSDTDHNSTLLLNGTGCNGSPFACRISPAAMRIGIDGLRFKKGITEYCGYTISVEPSASIVLTKAMRWSLKEAMSVELKKEHK